MYEPAIVFCPCCASALDVHGRPERQELLCQSCGQAWAMIVDPERLAEHSLT